MLWPYQLSITQSETCTGAATGDAACMEAAWREAASRKAACKDAACRQTACNSKTFKLRNTCPAHTKSYEVHPDASSLSGSP